ncbi:zinc-binding alcohol dehydrogenase family protein [Actinomadura barringtoniae]|uniref:Zinc-binding alcohol dehydrogenase family protein n=2 Tax=Actinomadura barringtoniae TaxID=1427535 RepID=A0A939PEI6_9ACTN|nr:zinc-binding alcohol dehydrogenase family protein [Actinomadura barringtoniae]
MVAAGIHPATRSIASGSHYSSAGAYPLVPGLDAVARTPEGRLVYTGFVQDPYGTLAERMAAPLRARFPLAEGAAPEPVAGGINPGLSTWLPLRARSAEVEELGTVLVLGVTGTAGYLAVQNARLLGATRVIGVGRNPAGLERAIAAGADTVAFTGDQGTDADALTTALGDTAPSLVLDLVWGGPAEVAFHALTRQKSDATDISFVQIGSGAGESAAVPASLLRSRKFRISGSGAGSVSPADALSQIPAYVEMICDGRVQVPTRAYPLSKVAEAWAAAAESGPRVVVVPDRG